MPKKASNQNLSGLELTAAIAEKVLGWKNVHKHNGELIGRSRTSSGDGGTAKVPDYANDPAQYAIDERMKQLGRSARYLKELGRITKATNLPSEWATPEQRSRAQLKRWGSSGNPVT
jgi:hypothetical protein